MPKTVLLVDDSATMRNLLKAALPAGEWNTISAQDGVKALKGIKNYDVDLVITDINMPNMNGIELIKELRKDPKNQSTPILIITTEGSEKNKADGKAAGANGWLVKPFTEEALKRAIDALVR